MILEKIKSAIEGIVILTLSLSLGFGIMTIIDKWSQQPIYEEGNFEQYGVKDKIVMYSTSWCPVCEQAREYFKENDISYIEYDVENTLKGKDTYNKFGKNGVPIFILNSTKINGFSKIILDELLKSQPSLTK